MSIPINQQISGLTVRDGGKLFAGYSNTTNNIYGYHGGPPKLLPYSIKAAFNASGKDEDLCLPNTRVDILNQIRAWIDGYDGPNIFWLSGWAGTGKSIIARTISREYHDKGRQGANFFASFFFSRSEEDASNAGKFVTTIAVQLAKFPVLGKRIHKAALDDDELANKILHDQWNQLVIEPVSKLNIKQVYTTLVLVIDALDECDKQGDIWRVLQLLAYAGTLQTIRLRILITSRPETSIRNGFSHFLQGVYHEFILHEIPKSIVDDDIHIFLDHSFGHHSLTGWPGKEAIELLVQKSAGLFIWAATAYRFIYGDRSFVLPIAKKRLQLILQSNGLNTKPEDELDKIYTTVLKNSAHHDYNQEEKEIVYGMLREILGSIVCLLSPLSADSLAILINLSGEDLKQTLENLHSILDVPAERARPVRLHHPSFRDFFLDTKRCTNRQLQVDEKRIHWVLANSCIRIMSEMLKKDICTLQLPGALASEVEDSQIEHFLPEELQYACSYWVGHLRESKTPLPDNGDVHIFLQKHLLFWLEALSWLKKISQGISALISLEVLVEVDQSPSLHAYIHDAKRFSLKFRYIIEKAPLQIYSSALLFAPEMSLIRKGFERHMPNWITGVIKRQNYWGQSLQTLEGHSSVVVAVVFSPDGKLVASASDDNTVRLWDPSTGATVHTLEGHSEPVNAVVFSPSGELVASASADNTVRLWDPSTGATLHTLAGHLKPVTAAVFSPYGKLIATASNDNTVRLWDSFTGAKLRTLKGHFDSVMAVVFSPNGKLIASGSNDSRVRLWDSSTGAMLQTLEGHSRSVTAVACSPDGKLVASASWDATVRLWDSATGMMLQTLKGHSSLVEAVVFSPDGELVASASADNTVRLWDSTNGVTLQTLKGHSSWVRAVVFSPDGKLIASASDDDTVRLWDSSTGAMLQTLEGHTGLVTAVVFSPDGKLVASASWDDTVRLWDLSTAARLKSLEGHSDLVTAVVYSPDGKLVASASYDNMVMLWNPSTGSTLHTLKGHLDSVMAVVFSPNGKLIASGSNDSTVRLWDSSTGATLQTLEEHSKSVTAVLFSPDGKLVASASDDNTVRLWDSSNGAKLQNLEGHSKSVTAVVFSPDSKLLASVSSDNTVRIWESSTGAALQTLEGHSSWVRAVVFSPEGKLAASASTEDSVKLWHSPIAEVLQTPEAHSSFVNSVMFSPIGKLVTFASDDNKTGIWDLPTYRAPPFIYILSFSRAEPWLEPEIDFSPAYSNNTNSSQQPKIAHSDLQDRWIVGTIGNLLWLPPDYLALCSGVRNSSIVLGHASGGISFLHFDLSQL